MLGAICGGDLMKSNSYLGAHVHWKVVKGFTVEAKRRGKPRRWSGLDIAGSGGDVMISGGVRALPPEGVIAPGSDRSRA
jgi:hypothetical protein